MDILPAELKVVIAEGVADRVSRIFLSMATRTWRRTIAHVVFDSVRWDTAQLATAGQTLVLFLERTGHRIKHVDLTIRFPDEDAPDHHQMDQILSVFTYTPSLGSLAFCARSSGRARHADASDISRTTYPMFSSALDRLSHLYEVAYDEYCRIFGGRFARLVLLAAAPRIRTLLLRAPMLCKKLDDVLAHSVFPAVQMLELHDHVELDVPADVFPAVEHLAVHSEHGASANFPSQLIQSFAQTLASLSLDSIGCPNATPLLALPLLQTLYVDQSVPAVISLFTRTPVVHIVVQNAAQVHVRVFKDLLRGSTGPIPFSRLESILLLPRAGRRAQRLNESSSLAELDDICEARGIVLVVDDVVL